MAEVIESETCAARIGAEHGRNAASWLFDGNTTTATYQAFLTGVEDGDPEILDQLPHADLSGEWADGYTPQQLAEDCGVTYWETEDDGLDVDGFCDAYEEAFSLAVEASVVEACHSQLDE